MVVAAVVLWRSRESAPGLGRILVNSGSRTAISIALIVLVLLGVGHIFVPWAPDADKIPLVVVYGDVVLGVASLVAAAGLMKRAQWGSILTLIIAALNILSAAPGVVAAPNPALRVVTAAYVLLSLVIIALMAPFAGRNLSKRPVAAPE